MSSKKPTHYICKKCKANNYIRASIRIKSRCWNCGLTYLAIPIKKYSTHLVIPVEKNIYKLY